MQKILLIEDDAELAGHLCEFLSDEGFCVLHAVGQSQAQELIFDCCFDLALVDVVLSDGNGFSVCRQIKEKIDIPVIFLTASADEECTVAGFEIGADDYIAKPFRPRELIARIKNALRKKNGHSMLLQSGDVCIDTVRGVVTKNSAEIFLSALEYRLLLIFFANKNKLLSRDLLIDELWSQSGEFVSDNTLTVYIKRLREKIEDDAHNPNIIKTVRGLGYKVGE